MTKLLSSALISLSFLFRFVFSYFLTFFLWVYLDAQGKYCLLGFAIVRWEYFFLFKELVNLCLSSKS